MKHRYSLAHLSALRLPPPELIEVAARAGFDYVGLRTTRVTAEEPLYALTDDRQLMRETKARLADTGVRVLDIELARMGPEQDARSYLPLLEVAAELDAKEVIGQLPDPDRTRARDRFAELCDLAMPLGIHVNLEFPSWTETPDLATATQVLREVNRPNAGMLIDILHFGRSGSSLEQLSQLPRSWFRYVHVCDAPAEAPADTRGLIHAARFERLFPGEGGLGVREILACLPDDIPYALEIPRVSLARVLGDEEYVRLALDAARRHLDTWTQTRSGGDARRSAAAHPGYVP
jgi:sugar phosphate isomerase/epimerase